MFIRRAIEVEGAVQGVGFRPFAHTLARRHGLVGWVRNGGAGVQMEIEGPRPAIDRFAEAIRVEAPPLANIEHVTESDRAPLGADAFVIVDSDVCSNSRAVVPDAATCEQCLEELLDPADRRHGHAFISCVHCGPRLTIQTATPYDRPRTTMHDFELCPTCHEEYRDPAGRRFHAQTIACHECGPTLVWLDASGEPLSVQDPLSAAASALREGAIVAIKGIGGFHLACDASSRVAVRTLRARKLRDQKPFAVMVPDLGAAGALAHLADAERSRLSSGTRPIVVARARAQNGLAPEVTRGLGTVGVFLPYSPVHHLLLRRLSPSPLVMTSGNRSNEAIVVSDEDAVDRLGGIADAFLSHTRRIVVPCEDGVVRVAEDRVVPIRRSRGECPSPLELPRRLDRPTLAVGGQFKAVFALGVGDRVLLGPHFGDLDEVSTLKSWRDSVAHFESLFGIHPERIVHDRHPDYESTRYALERGVELLSVQHHHAHMAACMAEHGLDGSVVAVCFDGVGYGDDANAWGGEFFVGGYEGARRVAHLAASAMPGGDRAVTEPWRLALAQVLRAGAAIDLVPAPSPAELERVKKIIEKNVACPLSSSAGRLFDAVASLILAEGAASYEAELPCRLEALAETSDDAGCYPVVFHPGEPVVVDPRPIVRGVVSDLTAGVDRARVARRFHHAVVSLVVGTCERIREHSGLERVVLSGGVFCNALLAREAPRQLERAGFRAYTHERVPPNDAGLALGQLAVAAAVPAKALGKGPATAPAKGPATGLKGEG